MSTSKGKGRTSYRQRAERPMSRQLSQVDAAGAALDTYAAVADDYAKRLTMLHEGYDKERAKLEDVHAKARTEGPHRLLREVRGSDQRRGITRNSPPVRAA
ncbi:hypothetical protein [Fodinicola acaciae]|uniref:hypothetical protein n=1 Tax=Fodinicola acaciae TaxID=2681555 RepID=UPI0013D32595|nr:hypothetical protein [Fodinicola acaciae]